MPEFDFADISQISYRQLDGRSVLLRLLEGIGYRFRRASTGLTQGHRDYRPAPGAMSVSELYLHLARMLDFCNKRVAAQLATPADTAFTAEAGADAEADAEAKDILRRLARLHALVAQLPPVTSVEAEFFCLINGPLADSLTHIGQLNLYKRLLGISSPAGAYFTGAAVAE